MTAQRCQPSSELDQHINWIRGFLETMTADNWADNKLHIERQMDSVGQQVAALVKEVEGLRTWQLASLESRDMDRARIEELEGALRALRLQALQSSVNDPSNEWGLEALHLANAALSDGSAKT